MKPKMLTLLPDTLDSIFNLPHSEAEVGKERAQTPDRYTLPRRV
jgi:hypothetical protein